MYNPTQMSNLNVDSRLSPSCQHSHKIYAKCLMYRWVQLEQLHWWRKHALGQILKDVVAWALPNVWACNLEKAHSLASIVSPFNHVTKFFQILFPLIEVLLELFSVSILCIVKRWYRSIVAKREMLVVEVSLCISITSSHMTISVCQVGPRSNGGNHDSERVLSNPMANVQWSCS